MVLVVASIGSEGLLGTGQLWVDGRSTLQLHQLQWQAAHASAHLTNSLVRCGSGVNSLSVGSSAGTVLSY